MQGLQGEALRPGPQHLLISPHLLDFLEPRAWVPPLLSREPPCPYWAHEGQPSPQTPPPAPPSRPAGGPLVTDEERGTVRKACLPFQFPIMTFRTFLG